MGDWALEAFPEYAGLSGDCLIPNAIRTNRDIRDVSNALVFVDQCGARASIIDRLRITHPPETCHRSEFDRRFWTVWTEAFAFAWSVELAGYDHPEFTDDRGKPDLRVYSTTWLEAKTIEHSNEEKATLDYMARASDRGTLLYRLAHDLPTPHPTLIKKFNEDLLDAIAKRNRQGRGELIVFFRVAGFDFPLPEEIGEETVRAWSETIARESGVRVVITYSFNWREPFVDTRTRERG